MSKYPPDLYPYRCFIYFSCKCQVTTMSLSSFIVKVQHKLFPLLPVLLLQNVSVKCWTALDFNRVLISFLWLINGAIQHCWHQSVTNIIIDRETSGALVMTRQEVNRNSLNESETLHTSTQVIFSSKIHFLINI